MQTPMLQIDFTQMAEPAERGVCLPAGWYGVAVASTAAKPNKEQTGGYLQFDLKVMDGPHAGNTVFLRLNLWSQNETAQRIAYEDFKRLSMATGVLAINSPDAREFIGRTLRVKLGIEEGSAKPDGNRYPDQNRILQMKSTNDPTAFDQPAAPAAPAQAFPAAPAPMPQQAAPPVAGGFPGAGAAQPWPQPAAAAPAPAQQPVQPSPPGMYTAPAAAPAAWPGQQPAAPQAAPTPQAGPTGWPGQQPAQAPAGVPPWQQR